MVNIRRTAFDEFCSWEPVTVKGNLTMVKMLGEVTGGELVMETWISPMGHYPLVYEVGMSLAYTTLIFSLIKVIHAKHLKWY